MTTEEFLELFARNVRADIGEGELTRVDLEHLAAIFEDTRAYAARPFLPVAFPTTR